MATIRTHCPNFNHGKSNAPVRNCPRCGDPVNAALRPKTCAESAHATRRKSGDAFCVDCGTGLRVGR